MQNESLQARLMRIARKEEGIPGYRKLWGALRDEGINCSQNRVQRLLQPLDIEPAQQ